MELNTMSNSLKSIVEIRQAYKSYSSDAVVLQGLDMTVPKGGIYALLGSSGCGKSTLLNCIMGQCTLDSGSIKLDVKRRFDIGFMPQDIYLYQDLTSYENMLIFGYLLGMKKEKIFPRADEIIELLEIPSGNRYVKTLSGGQQRRVSMAVTLLHDPTLLILDEPTVGVDVHLCQIIWNYFVRLTSLGKTIIITTHYIQEAHKAQKVGLMRRGVLIAEENPQFLMESYECDNLENLFLRLSQEQETKNLSSSAAKGIGYSQKTHFEEDDKKVCFQRLKSVLYKDAIQLSRSYAYVLTLVIVPLIQVLNFHWTFGGPLEKLNIGIVNDEILFHDCKYTAYSSCFTERTTNYSLSCMYMDLLRNKTYKLKIYEDEAAAVRAVKKNDVWGALHFPKNYTEMMVDLFMKNKSENGFHPENLKINAWVDLSSNFVGLFVKRDIVELVRIHLEKALMQCGLNPKLSNYPGGISFQEAFNKAGDIKSAGMSSILPSLLMMLSLTLSSTSAAMIGVEEKVSGTVYRMQTAGLSLYEFLISVLVVQVFLQVVRLCLTFVLVYWILGYTQRGDLLSLILLIFLVGICGILFGIITSVITENPTVTMLSQNAFAYIVAFCSGVLWPVQGQHEVLHALKWIFPFEWTSNAARGISLQDLPITNEIILEGFAYTFAWIMILAATIFFILKYKPNALVGKI